AVTRPGSDRFNSSKSTRPRSGGKTSHSGTGGPGHRGHHTVLFLAAVVFLNVALSVQHADQLHCFALRGNRISNRKVYIGTPDGFFSGFTAGDEETFAGSLEEEIFR